MVVNPTCGCFILVRGSDGSPGSFRGEAVEGSSPIGQLLSCVPFFECPPDVRLTALVTKRSILGEEKFPPVIFERGTLCYVLGNKM